MKRFLILLIALLMLLALGCASTSAVLSEANHEDIFDLIASSSEITGDNHDNQGISESTEEVVSDSATATDPEGNSLSEIPDRKNNSAQLESYYSARNSVNHSGLSVGDHFVLGNYEIVSVDWDSRHYMSETSLKQVPLEWKILEINGSQAVAIAVYLLSGQGSSAIPFDKSFDKVVNEQLTWENSSVREWLNNEFYNNAFSESEKAAILTTPLENKGLKDYGDLSSPNTLDRVYFLSYEEVLKYMPNRSDRKCYFYGDVGMDSDHGFCTRTVTVASYGGNYIVQIWGDGSITFLGTTRGVIGSLPVICVDLNML